MNDIKSVEFQEGRLKVEGEGKVKEGLREVVEKNRRKAERELEGVAVFLAGRFAAKEAIIKAHERRLTFHDIVIRRPPADEKGTKAPRAIVLSKSGDERNGQVVKISISHDTEFATAVCLAVKDEEVTEEEMDERRTIEEGSEDPELSGNQMVRSRVKDPKSSSDRKVVERLEDPALSAEPTVVRMVNSTVPGVSAPRNVTARNDKSDLEGLVYYNRTPPERQRAMLAFSKSIAKPGTLNFEDQRLSTQRIAPKTSTSAESSMETVKPFRIGRESGTSPMEALHNIMAEKISSDQLVLNTYNSGISRASKKSDLAGPAFPRLRNRRSSNIRDQIEATYSPFRARSLVRELGHNSDTAIRVEGLPAYYRKVDMVQLFKIPPVDTFITVDTSISTFKTQCWGLAIFASAEEAMAAAADLEGRHLKFGLTAHCTYLGHEPSERT
jgi:phosphopantetheinyl transferase (holo-ACP synthase)